MYLGIDFAKTKYNYNQPSYPTMKNPILTLALALALPLASMAQTTNSQMTQPTKPTPATVKKVTKSTTSATVVNKNTKSSGLHGGTTAKPGTTTKPTTNTKPTATTKPTITPGKPPVNNTPTTTPTTTTVTQSDAASAIKQALVNGITTGVGKVSVLDGYFGNPEIKIPLPADLQPVDAALRGFGAGEMVDKLVVQLNRSAEQAATQATPIFLNSINQLTITDAISIVSNQQQDAATAFLKRATTEQLVAAFKPKIKTVLDETKTNEVYGSVMGYYNKIPFVTPVEADLSDYVTRKALDGLFIMIAKEEAKIRQDPKGQVNNIIHTVFGKYAKK